MRKPLASLLAVLFLLSQLLLWSGFAPAHVAYSPDAVVLAPPVSTEEAIQEAELPWRDLAELAVRLKGLPPETASPAPVEAPPERQVGERATFWVADQTNNSYFTVEAVLRVVTPNAYMYVAEGTRIDPARLEEAARVFEEKIYTVNRRNFGPEPPVGLDGDPHVTILNASIPGVGGYFTSVDGYPRTVHPYSNERKAIYINVDSAPPGSLVYYGILAHEFEHMIQSNVNRFEQTWVKEGSAEVAMEAAGLGSSGAMRLFESNPDTQLNAWADSKGDVAPHYGAAYLFLSYFLEQFGGYQVAADLLTGATRGLETFDRFLSERALGESFEDVFRDWVVANYLDEASAREPRYQYQKLRIRAPATERVTSSTGWQERTVQQFAADYLEIAGSWSGAKIQFEGDQTTRVIPARAQSGRYFWWSNRADLVNTSLTHVFDLRGLTSATLRFWTWYDLEEDYDYAYVTVSRDGGLTWATLPSADTRTSDPNGNNLGAGFTGRSAGAENGEWVEQEVDLSPYAGDVVVVRFELVTDDAYNAPGFAVDDISIPELGYESDVEEDAGGWVPTGFIRTDGELPQRFSLRLIRFGDDIAVEDVPLSPSQSAEVVLHGRGPRERAVLVVSALTRHTTEPAGYRYAVQLTP